MSKYVLFLLVLLSGIFILSCANSQTSEFILEDLGKKERIVQEIVADDINTIIKQKDYTVLFFYTTWCSGSHYNLENEINTSLDTMNIHDDLSIAIIGLAKNKQEIQDLMDKYEINYVTYYLNSPIGSGVDKSKISKTLKQVFKNYKSTNGVPVSILCDNKFQILEGPAGYTFNTIISLFNKHIKD